MSELKPCPFCGGEADKAIGQTGDGKPWEYVECIGCGGMVDSIAAWNHRPAEDRLRRERDEHKQDAEGYRDALRVTEEELYEFKAMLDEVEACWENRQFALNMSSFDVDGNPLPGSPSEMDSILAKRKGK